MPPIVYLDGAYVDRSEALVSVWDHGFLYGDGVFEGIRAYNGRVFKLREHLVRLYNSARSLMITIPVTIDEMEKAVLETCRKNGFVDAYIRLVISRGVGDLGIDPRKCTGHATVVIIADRIALYPPETYEVGLKIVTAATRKNSNDAFSAQVKSLNYLNNILAKLEAIHAGVFEAVMVNRDGYITECTTENIFIVAKGELHTPPVHVGILKGITRDTVMELAEKRGIKVRELPFTAHDVYVAEECFVTGTGAEIIPVVGIDGRTIGSGKPGLMTAQLLADYRALTSQEGTAI